MAKNVLTICALGTGEDRQTEPDSIVRKVAYGTNGPCILLDGPGGFYFNDAPLSAFRRYKGILFGHGMDENIAKSVDAVIQQATLDPTQPVVVNLIGFSRGGITCLGIANAIQERWRTQNPGFPLPEVNIIAFDPVAGLFMKNRPDARLIPALVKNYIAFISLDEKRLPLKPQDLTRVFVEDYHSTNVFFLPIPGHHSHAIYLPNKRNDTVPKILHQFVKTQLSLWGTKFHPFLFPMDDLNGFKILELYACCYEDYDYYETMGDHHYLLKPRQIRKRHEEYVFCSNYFLNQHHRELFKILYPAVFNFYFEQRLTLENNFTDEEILKDLNQLLKQSPISFKHLTRYFQIIGRPETAEDLWQAIETTELTSLPRGGPSGYCRIEQLTYHSSQIKQGNIPEKKDSDELFAKRLIEIANLYRRERRHEKIKNTNHNMAEKFKHKVIHALANREKIGNFDYHLIALVQQYRHKLELRGSNSRFYRALSLAVNNPIKIGWRAFVCRVLYYFKKIFSKNFRLRHAENLQKNNFNEIDPQTISESVGRYSNQYEKILHRQVQTAKLMPKTQSKPEAWMEHYFQYYQKLPPKLRPSFEPDTTPLPFFATTKLRRNQSCPNLTTIAAERTLQA